MRIFLSICLVSLFASACATKQIAAGGSGAAEPGTTVRVRRSDPFSPETGSAAVKAFIPDVAANDSGGECALRKLPNSTSQVATAAFPTRKDPLMNVSMTFDASGKVVRYSETRGVPRPKTIVGMSEAQRDSALKAAEEAMRSTVVTVDYAIDQGVAHNRGGGLPSHAVLTSAREIESLPQLGVKARMARFRKLCGV